MERIALFLPSLHGGGAERVMVNLARGFAARSMSVDIVLSKAKGPCLAEVPKEVRVVDLRARRTLSSLPGLVRYLRRERPTALLSALNHANIIVLWAKHLARVDTRVVISEHNSLSRATTYARTLRGKLMPLLMHWFYPWADAIVAVSEGVADDLVARARLPRDKVQVIYNPVVTPDLLAKAEEPLDHPWFQPGQPPVILGVGRLAKQKDFATLIRAFARVRQVLPARLLILGEGEERLNLERLVQEMGLDGEVALPGFVGNPFSFMKRAAVFALSSRWEGLPTVLIEALALGTPVVATDCPSGPAEILEGGKWGTVVPVGDAEALAEGIVLTMSTPHDKHALQRRAQLFHHDVILPEYLKVLGMESPV